MTTRTALPAREAWDDWLASHGQGDRNAQAIQAIRDVERAGGEVLVVVAAAADEAATRRAVDAARARWGAITGVIHAAGVAGAGAIAFRKEPRGRRRGARPEGRRTRGPRPRPRRRSARFRRALSSFNAILGAPGLCDYASANAVLDAFVDSDARPAAWSRVFAIDWGPWRDVGMAAKLVVPEAQRREREAQMRFAISPAAGADAFGRVPRVRGAAASSSSRSILAVRGWSSGCAPRATPPPKTRPAPLPPKLRRRPRRRPRPSDLSSAYEAPATDTERAAWPGSGRSFSASKRVGLYDDFFEARGAFAPRDARALARVDLTPFSVRLTLRDVFDAPTIHRLSGSVSRRRIPALRSSPSAADGDREREEIEF